MKQQKSVVFSALFRVFFSLFWGRILIFFAISQSFQKVRVNNKASLYTILYTNRFLHTQITQRETIIKMSTITTSRSLLSSASLRGSSALSSMWVLCHVISF
jgi:hypothetical protein